jgi:nucleolin
MCEGVLGAGTALKVRIATDRETGRSKGFAHVDFSTPDLASRAVSELNGVELMGRSLRIDHAQRKEDMPARDVRGADGRPAVRRDQSNQHSIFLGNLAWDVTPELVEDMVNDVLGPGLFNQVRLAIDRETGRQRGFGHIDFKDQETAERAVKELDGLEVMGRQLRADHAQRKEGGFEGGGGRGGGGRGGGGSRGGGRGGADRYQSNAPSDGSFGSW